MSGGRDWLSNSTNEAAMAETKSAYTRRIVSQAAMLLFLPQRCDGTQQPQDQYTKFHAFSFFISSQRPAAPQKPGDTFSLWMASPTLIG